MESIEKETQQREVQSIEGKGDEENEKEKDILEKRIKEIYMKGDHKFKISNMAMEIKKEVKKCLI